MGSLFLFFAIKAIINIGMCRMFYLRLHEHFSNQSYVTGYGGVFVFYACIYFSTHVFNAIRLVFKMFYRYLTIRQEQQDNILKKLTRFIVVAFIMPPLLLSDTADVFYIIFCGFGLSLHSVQ